MKSLGKQMLSGNVQMLILAILEAGPSYGYAIIKELNQQAEGILRLGEGTIYPVLHRLEERKIISAKWCLAENGRERKYYRLSAKGHRALAANRQQWQMLSVIMRRVLGSAANHLPTPQVKRATI